MIGARKYLSLALGALIALACLSASAPAAEPARTAGDKAAIEKIVHDYLLAHPEILNEMTAALDAKNDADEDKARSQALAGVGLKALLDPKIAYLMGPADAKATVVELFDYRCPHCKNSMTIVKKLIETNKNIRIALIEFPILTPDSVVAAKAAMAARRQDGKYLPFHFALMATTGALPKERILDVAKQAGLDVARLQKDMDDPAIVDALKQGNALAEKLHFNGTPTFVVNDQIVVGEVTADELSDMIKKAGG